MTDSSFYGLTSGFNKLVGHLVESLSHSMRIPFSSLFRAPWTLRIQPGGFFESWSRRNERMVLHDCLQGHVSPDLGRFAFAATNVITPGFDHMARGLIVGIV